ncbi:MAG: hypothetical protein A2287_05280 [Candidatus Melainabacteria bacterium RIFOXYA12_FULL_32_12]|nr:MAG: hypothetical protein A2287_05280 [Candidatus Melainabacteria bacterium RIFOXYA12_FULL_32_12]
MCKRIISLAFIIILMNLFVCPFSFAREVILENGTKVRLKLVDKVSTNLNSEGDEVNFIVMDDVKLADTTLIKEGTRATGFIAELIPRGKAGKAGNLTIYLDSTKAINGKRVPLSGTLTRKGEDKIILTAILSVLAFPPFSLLFLTMTGHDAQLPAGYQTNARVDRDVILSLDNSSFVPVSDFKY